jgi:glycosyltransferase involved in cell wall biosynthesis
MQKISHFIGLSGIGGVQKNFVDFLKNIDNTNNDFVHKVYTIGKVDHEYDIHVNILNIKNPINLLLLVKDIFSKTTIVHFYNNLSSIKVGFFLFFIPACKLIIHERGTAWNQPVKKGFVTRLNANKASIILVNSNATKTILTNKFLVPADKITVIYNGIDVGNKFIAKNKFDKNSELFNIGFIGRLDTPKGVHILIESMKYMEGQGIGLFIAGEGPLINVLKKQSNCFSNITFLGRIKNPYDFIEQIDLLIVPSIREPFGNICLEAGLSKTPVLAANIDGIPEIIKNGVSGELIKPTDVITMEIPSGALKLPEFVVNPLTQDLCEPKQINSKYLANKILKLSLRPEKLNMYAENLYGRVINYFNIDRYTSELIDIYENIKKGSR